MRQAAHPQGWAARGLLGFAHVARVFRPQLAGLPVFALDGFVDFLAVDRNVGGGVDAQPHFVAADIDNGYDDVVADHDAFVTVSRQDQHGGLLPLAGRVSGRQSGYEWWEAARPAVV